jgi:hypothetical protein
VVPAVTVTTASTETLLTGAGDIASCSTTKDEATAALLDGIGGEVFTLGDNAGLHLHGFWLGYLPLIRTLPPGCR